MTTTTAKRGVRVAIAAAAATLLASFGIAGPSAAATPNEARDGSSSLTIHKYEGAPVAGENNGTELAVEPALPGLNDVEFTLQPVLTGGAMFDLATNDGWAAAQDLFDVVGSNPTAAELTAAGVTLGAGSTQITAGGTPTQGAEATFSDLHFGLYYVTETDAPAGTTPAAPFLVSVPLTNAADQSSWLYDVHVYPKNSVSAVEKEVEDSGSIQLGDEVVFTITADIPDLAEGTPIDGYKIVDDLDEKLDHVSATVELSNGTALPADAYTVTPDVATPGGPEVTVEFTESGRAILKANADAQVIVTITTTVNTVGEIENSALLYPNAPSFDIEPGEPGGPGEPEEPVVTKWGGITLNKTNAADGSPVEGARFHVYAGSTDVFAEATPVTVDGVAAEDGGSVWTSAEGGMVVIEGLRYSTWANNAEVAPGEAGYLYYWLVEIESPEGFELLPEPISFEVNSQSTAQTVTVENIPSNSGFELPLTGGAGTTAIYAAGALILAGGLVLAARSRRAKA